jgi:hypothetical protein
MSDRLLLEQAAAAAGLSINVGAQAWRDSAMDPESASLWLANGNTAWNPLKNSGEALRLVVVLRLHIGMETDTVSAWEADHFGNFQTEILAHRGPEEATRRAIVRAAAAITQRRAALEARNG